MASSSTPPGATANKPILTPVMALEGHEPYSFPWSDGNDPEYKYVSCISYFPDGKQMISGSGDKTIRRWDLGESKEIEEARQVCEYHISAVGVSRDGRWIVTGGGGELKVCEVETRIVRTFHHEGHLINIWIDISVDSTLVVGWSWNGTVRIWNLETGKLVAGPFNLKSGSTSGHAGLPRLRLSENSRKLVVTSHSGKCLQVWDIRTQKLDVTRGKHVGELVAPPLPVFWTTKDKSIVAAFSFTRTDDRPMTIYEFDASTLKTVGAPFEEHTKAINGLALSSDCVLLASASFDQIKLWAFESRQLLASFDILLPTSLTLSPDSRQLAYAEVDDTKIYICNIPANILASIGLAEEPQPSTSKSERLRLAGLLDSDATRRTVHRKPVIVPVTSPIPPPSRPLPTRDPHAFLHFLRKLVPSRTDAVRPDEPHNLLDFPATLPLPRPHIIPNENSRSTPAPATVQSSPINASTSFKSRLHQLSTWWPVQADHAPAIVDVPLAQGKQRNAAAGAPGDDDEWIRDEEYISPPPSPNPGSRQPPTTIVVNAGEHGSGRFCFCL